MSVIDNLFDGAMGLFADLMSNGTYDILRPDYSSETRAESHIRRKIGIPVDVASSRVEAAIPGVDYYILGIPVTWTEVGDVISPSPARPGVPTLTVRSKDGGGKDLIAFRTDEVGSLLLNRSKTKFEHVRYGIIGMLNPEQSIVPEFDASPEFVQERIVFYTRNNVRVGQYLKLQNGRIMQFRSVETIGPITVVIATERKG